MTGGSAGPTRFLGKRSSLPAQDLRIRYAADLLAYVHECQRGGQIVIVNPTPASLIITSA
jgi:hypothetical protein